MDDSALDEIKKGLYRRGSENKTPEREAFQIHADRAVTSEKVSDVLDWQTKEESEPETAKDSSFEGNKSIMKKIIWASLIFLFAGIVTAGYFVFFENGKSVSARNIDIETQYSAFTDGGALNEIVISVTNKNAVSLELADLILEYPTGVFSKEGKKLGRERSALGVIKSGETLNKKTEVIFYGNENEEKEVKITLEYRLSDSNAIFAKESSYSIKITRSPIGVSISIPKELNSGQTVEISTEIVSNSDSDLSNLLLRMEYPPGFQFISATPNPSQGRNEWSVGFLPVQEKRTIVIKGLVQGQDLEEKAFRAEVGVLGENNNLRPYGIVVESLEIKRPFLGLDILVNGIKSEKAFASVGDTVNVSVQYTNNLPVPIRNNFVEATLEGIGFEENSINVVSGSYRSSNKTIVWNASSLRDLEEIQPGEGGKISFSFRVPKNIAVGNDSSAVNIKVSIKGLSVSDESQTNQVEGISSQNIQIASRLQLVSRISHGAGVFNNSGPLPPRVGQETTYTVSWSLSNNLNDFGNVKVVSSLPAYVRWTGNVSPDEDVFFEESTGRVEWKTGVVKAGTGINRSARVVSFQIGFTPASNQVGTSPILLSETVLTGHDLLIDRTIQDSRPFLTTDMKNEPGFSADQARVVE